MQSQLCAFCFLSLKTIKVNLVEVRSNQVFSLMTIKQKAFLTDFLGDQTLNETGTENLTAMVSTLQKVVSLYGTEQLWLFFDPGFLSLTNFESIVQILQNTPGISPIVARMSQDEQNPEESRIPVEKDPRVICVQNGPSMLLFGLTKGKLTFCEQMETKPVLDESERESLLSLSENKLDALQKKLYKSFHHQLEEIDFDSSSLLYLIEDNPNSIRKLLMEIGWMKPTENTIDLHLLRDLAHLLESSRQINIEQTIQRTSKQIEQLFDQVLLLNTLAQAGGFEAIVLPGHH